MDASLKIQEFLDGKGKNRGRKADERYASFDYCYNYFYSFYSKRELHKLADTEHMQTSCLQLGFYLASWGMLRGSSFLLEKSVRSFSPLIAELANMSPKLWEIDVDTYDDNNIALLLECRNKIRHALGVANNPSDILITKIMLGVFGNIPAFDQYFRKSLDVHTVSKKSLLKIRAYYEQHKKDFDTIAIRTLDFQTGKDTGIRYTKAKLVDMAGFMNRKK